MFLSVKKALEPGWLETFVGFSAREPSTKMYLLSLSSQTKNLKAKQDLEMNCKLWISKVGAWTNFFFFTLAYKCIERW